MGKLQGPFVYDSLDRPNADKTQQMPQSNTGAAWVTLIIAIAVLVFFLVAYVLYWLNTSYSSAASLALWILMYGVIGGVIALVFVGVFYVFVLALRKALVSLNDGMHVGIFSAQKARYDVVFETLANRYFDMWETRMRNSQYSGIQTLTLDQSVQSENSTTSVQTEPESTTPPELPLGKDKSILEELKDKGIIGRSGNSLFVGFSKKE